MQRLQPTVAEFNIKIDPQAAHMVFNEKWPLTMVGLDLRQQALATPDVMATVEAVGTKTAQCAVEILRFYTKMYNRKGKALAAVHDQCAVANMIGPSVMTTQKMHVDIELTGALATGMAVADFRSAAPVDCHTSVGVTLDCAKFLTLVVDALQRIW